MDSHEIICILKDLAVELQKTPTKFEFLGKTKVSENSLKKVFGNYTALLLAAGLDTYRQKITNEIYIRPLDNVLSEHKPRISKDCVKYSPTLILGDTHFPFISKYGLDAVFEFARLHEILRIIQVGDLYDLYAHSKFPKSLNVYRPAEEETLARDGAVKMWTELRKICPKAECIQIKGNHDVRPVKRTLEHAPSLEHIVSKHIDQLMTFDGVKLISDPREEFKFDDVQVIHGYKSGLGQHSAYAVMNTIAGHSHKGGVVYKRYQDQTIWELNAGFLGEPDSKAFSYTPQKTMDMTLGFGFLDEYGPRFIHL